MITLFHGGGAWDFERLSLKYNKTELRAMTTNVQRLLQCRGHEDAVEILTSVNFEVWESTNSFSDEFAVLYAEVPLHVYESMRCGRLQKQGDYALIAGVFQELGVCIRFIACGLNTIETMETVERPRFLKGEILKLVNEYIGVHGGYLGDFSYRTHREFYPQFCGVEANPDEFEGTTRERFIKILESSDTETQARIFEGVLRKYPVGSEPQRTQQLQDHFCALVGGLRRGTAVPIPDLRTASEVLRLALNDAETLIRQGSAVSAVDRIHTVLHGYLMVVCRESAIDYEANASLTRLFRSLRQEHPALAQAGAGSDEVGRVLQGCATIMDALNPLRNRLSVAHPNEQLLQDEEAMLVVNITRTLLHYLDAKLTGH